MKKGRPLVQELLRISRQRQHRSISRPTTLDLVALVGAVSVFVVRIATALFLPCMEMFPVNQRPQKQNTASPIHLTTSYTAANIYSIYFLDFQKNPHGNLF